MCAFFFYLTIKLHRQMLRTSKMSPLQSGKWCVHLRNEWKSTRSQHNSTTWSIITRYRLASWQQLMSSLSSCSEIIILLGCTNLQAMTSPPSPPYKASLSSPVKKKERKKTTLRERKQRYAMILWGTAVHFTPSTSFPETQHESTCKSDAS